MSGSLSTPTSAGGYGDPPAGGLEQAAMNGSLGTPTSAGGYGGTVTDVATPPGAESQPLDQNPNTGMPAPGQPGTAGGSGNVDTFYHSLQNYLTGRN